MAQRDVIYNLKAVNDPGNVAAFRALAEAQAESLRIFKEGQSEINRINEKSVKERAATTSRATEAATRESEKADEQRTRATQAAAREQQKAIEQTQRAYATATGAIRAGNMKLQEGLFGTVEGTMRLARGFTLLGFSANKDIQKLIEKLAMVQGSFDLVLGGIKIYTSITKAVEGYRAAVLAAAAAETVLAAARARSAAAGGVGGVAGGIGTGAAGSAGGSAIAGAGGSVAVGGGISALALPAAAAAAVASVIAGLVSLGATLSDIRKYGLMGGGVKGGWNDTIATSMIDTSVSARKATGIRNPFYKDDIDKVIDQDKVRDTIAKTGKQDRERDDRLYLNQQNDKQLSAIGRTAADEAFQLRMQSREPAERFGFGGDPASMRADRKFDLGIAKAGLRGDLSDNERSLSNEKNQDDVLRLMREQAVIKQKLLDHSKEAVRLDNEEATEKIANSKSVIASLEAEKDAAVDAINSLTDRMASFKEKFGNATGEEQAKWGVLATIAKKAADLREAGKGKEADSVLGGLTREDRMAALGSGDSRIEAEAGRRASELAAERAGFKSDLFGGGERKDIDRLGESRETVNRLLKVQRELVVTVESDRAADAAVIEAALRKDREDLIKLLGEISRNNKEEMTRAAQEIQDKTTNEKHSAFRVATRFFG